MFNLKIRKEQLLLTGSHTSKQSPSQAMPGYFLCDTIRYPGSTAYVTWGTTQVDFMNIRACCTKDPF